MAILSGFLRAQKRKSLAGIELEKEEVVKGVIEV
jgi:hypothetical protein